jgi:hypothetical protein
MAKHKTEWVSKAVLARELGTSRQAVHNWVLRGLIKAKKSPEMGFIVVERITVKPTR